MKLQPSIGKLCAPQLCRPELPINRAACVPFGRSALLTLVWILLGGRPSQLGRLNRVAWSFKLKGKMEARPALQGHPGTGGLPGCKSVAPQTNASQSQCLTALGPRCRNRTAQGWLLPRALWRPVSTSAIVARVKAAPHQTACRKEHQDQLESLPRPAPKPTAVNDQSHWGSARASCG